MRRYWSNTSRASCSICTGRSGLRQADRAAVPRSHVGQDHRVSIRDEAQARCGLPHRNRRQPGNIRLAGHADLVPVPRYSGRVSVNLRRPTRYSRRIRRVLYLAALSSLRVENGPSEPSVPIRERCRCRHLSHIRRTCPGTAPAASLPGSRRAGRARTRPGCRAGEFLISSAW
ncbi:transposase [Nocardia sp. NPDC004711]